MQTVIPIWNFSRGLGLLVCPRDRDIVLALMLLDTALQLYKLCAR